MPSATATPPQVLLRGHGLSRTEREQLLAPYLPKPRHDTTPTQACSARTEHRSLRSRFADRLAALLLHLIHTLVYLLLRTLFTIHLRLRQTRHAVRSRLLSLAYHHHRTPELITRDVRHLSRLPQHLSVILTLDAAAGSAAHPAPPDALDRLTADAAELAAWCAAARIPLLSIYEPTGALKAGAGIPRLHRACADTLRAYFPPGAAPALRIRAPNTPAYSPPESPSPSPPSSSEPCTEQPAHMLTLLLLSAADGRATLVDLTRTLAEMAQQGRLAPSDITSELVDAEISHSCCGEPDLLIVMASSAAGARGSSSSSSSSRRRKRRSSGGVAGGGSTSGHALDFADGVLGDGVSLRGYPPWQVRLTEIT